MCCSCSFAAEWQWSVSIPREVGKTENPRAFLWIPPNCQRLRGVVFAQHNMEEEPILENSGFRAALAELGFGEVWVAPGFDAYFRFDRGAGEKFDSMMSQLAELSGYDELKFVPLVPIGHSAAASMPWYIAAWKPQRVLACISVSGQWPYSEDEKNAPHMVGKTVDTVPGLVTMGEYEWADENLPKGARQRVEHPTMPLSALGCPADGHFAATDEKIDFLIFYLKKAVAHRLGENDSLKPIDASREGWLADRWRLNKPAIAPAAPVGQYTGDPANAFWWFDEETARAAEAFQSRHRGMPALLAYVQDGRIVPQVNGTHQQVTLKFLPGEDGTTFKLGADFLDTVPEGRPERWTGKKAGQPIERPQGASGIDIHKITGPIKKLTGDTWALDLYRENLLNDRRGNEAWLVATWLGDDRYKRAVQQAVMRIPRRNEEGADQTITFPVFADQKPDAAPIHLTATASSGLPVRYFVREGPAEVEGDILKFTSIPPRAILPIKVTVVGWQWGRSIEPRVKSAELVERTFSINK
jgi:hypothetical protein